MNLSILFLSFSIIILFIIVFRTFNRINKDLKKLKKKLNILLN